MGVNHQAIERINRREFERQVQARRMRVRLAAVRQGLGPRVTLVAVLYATALAFDVDAEQLKGPRRRVGDVRPRFAFAWLARNRLGASLPRIGCALNRDHTSARHQILRAETLRATDPDFAERLARAEFELWPGTRA